jgi:hypothetical protein
MYPGEMGFSTAMVLEAVLIFFWVSIVMGDPPIAGRFISWKKKKAWGFRFRVFKSYDFRFGDVCFGR